MQKSFIPALRMFVFMTVLTGVIYPFAVFVGAQLLFKSNAEGSLVVRDGKVVGSLLIAQKFTQPQYFWPRPSAVDYNPLSSGGSNLSQTSATLKTQVDERAVKLAAGYSNTVPQDLLFSSGSGLDPEISPQAAHYQIPRVAQARSMEPARLAALVDRFTEKRQLGFLGERRVNVLKLNLALEQNGSQ